MPLAELQEHLPPTCRYTYDIRKIRSWSMAIGGLGGTGIISLVLFAVFQSAVALFGGLLFGLMPGLMLGYWLLPRFGPKPIWMVRRLWMPADEVAEGEVAEDMSFLAGGYRRTIVGIPHDSQNEKTPLNDEKLGNFEAPAQSMGRLGLDGPEEGGSVYFPVVHHATTFFEMLQQRVNKKRMSQVKSGVWPKVAIGSIGILALGTMGILFFMWIINSDAAHTPPAVEGASGWLAPVIGILRS